MKEYTCECSRKWKELYYSSGGYPRGRRRRKARGTQGRLGVFVSVSMFKGPSDRGSLAGTGLKVRVSGGFKEPSQRSMPSNGSGPQLGARWLDLPLICPIRLLPPTCLINRWRSKTWKWIFSPLLRSLVLPAFFSLSSERARPTKLFLSLSLSLASSPCHPLTLITHLDAGRRREERRKNVVRHMFRKSLCVMRRKTMCSGSLQPVNSPPLAYVISTFNLPL